MNKLSGMPTTGVCRGWLRGVVRGLGAARLRGQRAPGRSTQRARHADAGARRDGSADAVERQGGGQAGGARMRAARGCSGAGRCRAGGAA